MLNWSVAFERLVVALILLLLVWGIWSFGIWNPWELETAEAARTLRDAGTETSHGSILRAWLIGMGFETVGVHAWAGRLPGVFGGLLTCLLAFSLVRRYADRRAAVIAIVVLGTSPLFLLNVRLMMGEGIGFAAQTWVGLAAFHACTKAVSNRGRLTSYAWLGGGIGVSTLASGVLLGPLPPLLAVGVWSMLARDTDGRHGVPLGRSIVVVTGAGLVAGVVRAVIRDGTDFSFWIGAGAVGGNPPTYDKGLELVFHGFAPWSAALPVAALWVLAPRAKRNTNAQDLGWMLLLWAAFAYVAWTLFASRYGTPPYLAVVPLAGIVALWLFEIIDEPTARWPAAVVFLLLMALLIRDYALYPESALRGLPVEGLDVPPVVRTAGPWMAVFGLTALSFCLLLVSPATTEKPDAQRVEAWVRRQWARGPVERGWLTITALLLLACLVFGFLCLVADLRLASVVVRVGSVLFFLPIALLALVFGAPWLQYAYSRLGGARGLPVLFSGVVVAAYVTASLQPVLSQHFSPKAVYDAYEELAGDTGEPLASYRSSSTASRYYTEAPIEEIEEQSGLIDYLQDEGQRWAVIPSEDLAGLNRKYRRQTGRHLYVADGRNARLLLVAANPVNGRPNKNFIADHVLTRAPEVQHPLDVSFADQVELLGYDLDLPEGDYVGAGQRFSLTWLWRVTGTPPKGYQVFVHIDGYGQRINGDHVPVNGRYPIKYWEEGDLILDRQELTVPANYPVGDYVIYVGLFKGDERIDVVSGPNDGANRVPAGVLQVR